MTSLAPPVLLLSLCCLAILPPTPSGAQNGSDDNGLTPAEAREVYNYSLTMDKIRKMSAAATALTEIGKQHPEIKNLGELKTYDAMVQTLQRYPDAVAAITRNGFTPREYVDCLMTMMQGTIAVQMKKAGSFSDYPPEMLKQVSRANLAFMEQHWNEIQQMGRSRSPRN